MTAGDGKDRPRPRDPRKPTGSEAADLVSEVLEDAARREEARSRKQEPVVGRSRQRVAAVSVPLAGAFSFYLWFGNPAWITPTMPDPITAERAEQGLRVAMYFEAQKIEQFRGQSGRLPDSLQELGGTAPPEMTYSRIDATTYTLIGNSRGVTLTLDVNSDEAIAQFLGDAMTRLGIGQKR